MRPSVVIVDPVGTAEAGTAGSGLVPVDNIAEIGIDAHGDRDEVRISGGD